VQVFYLGEKVPAGAGITIGNFDGVHRGHQAIIAELKTAAGSRPTGLVTFEPAPQRFLNPEFAFILTPFEEKQARLAELGLDFMYVIPFDQHVRETSAETFLQTMILDWLQPELIVVGADHRFGRDRAGGTQLIARLQGESQFQVRVVPEFAYDRAPIRSTRIRERLILGGVRDAAEMLGYPYCLSGPIVAGQGIGVALGFPTINLQLLEPEKLIPAPGVYAVFVGLDRRPRPGAMNVGFRPTFAGTSQSLEVHVIDCPASAPGLSRGKLAGRRVTVEFVERLRPERKFDSSEALQTQIAADVALARLILVEPRATPT
jgi:riboflavin kinase/FMN adenylyltransferase